MKQVIYRTSILTLMVIATFFGTVFSQGSENTLSVTLLTKLENISDFSLSNDHSKLFFAKTNGDLHVWDLDPNKAILELNSSTFDARLNNLSWSSDDQLVAGAFSDKGRIWNAQTGELMYELNNHPIQLRAYAEPALAGGVSGITFSPSGTLLATYNYFDATDLLYDLQTFAIKYQLSDHQDAGIEEVTFSPDGNFLAVRQLVGGVTVWNAQTGSRLFQVSGEVMAFSPDSRLIATGLGRFYSYIMTWDLRTGEQVNIYSAPLSVNRLLWSADGQFLYANLTGMRLLDDGLKYNGETIYSWNVKNTELKHTFTLTEDQNLPLELAESETLIGMGTYHLEGDVLIWNRTSGEVFRQTLSSETPAENYHLAFNPIYTFDINSRQGILAAGHDEGVSLWNVDNGNFLNMISISSRVIKLSFSSTNDKLVILTDKNELYVWQVNA